MVPVARSLGRAGIPVHALGAPTDPIRYSRYCRSYVEFEDDAGFQAGCLESLLGQSDGGVIMPASDDGVDLAARNRGLLVDRGYTVYQAEDAVTLAMLDKAQTYALAQRIGIPAPRRLTLLSAADVETAAQQFSFPCALKPLSSHVFARQPGFGGKVLIANSAEELRRLIDKTVAHGLEMMAIEIIPGGDDQLYGYSTYIDETGEPLFHFVERKLRQEPIQFGNGCYRIGEWNSEAADLGLRFCRESGLRGVAHVEFRKDSRDGQLKLMECNNRFDLCTQLICSSGIDLPLLVYNKAVGRPPPPLPSPKYGRRVWHPLPDYRAMRSYRRLGQLTRGAWIRSLLHPQRFTVFSWRDPMPSITGHGQWVAGVTRRRIGRLARSLGGRRP